MKISILCLVALVQAVKIRDADELDLPKLVDENDVKIDTKLDLIKTHYKDISKNDDGIIETMELQLHQAKRNA